MVQLCSGFLLYGKYLKPVVNYCRSRKLTSSKFVRLEDAMLDSILSKYNVISDEQQLVQLRAELMSIGEKERILRERSADREAYRYLLDAHRSIENASLFRDQGSNMFPQGMSKEGQLAA